MRWLSSMEHVTSCSPVAHRAGQPTSAIQGVASATYVARNTRVTPSAPCRLVSSRTVVTTPSERPGATASSARPAKSSSTSTSSYGAGRRVPISPVTRSLSRAGLEMR